MTELLGFKMNEIPIILHFFNKDNVNKFAGLCTKIGVNMETKELDDNTYQVTTEPFNKSMRRKIILAWAELSVERK